MKTLGLEPKYRIMATKLSNIKYGNRGHNIWFLIIRTWYSISLNRRLQRLKSDREENMITKEEYEYWSSIIMQAL